MKKILKEKYEPVCANCEYAREMFSGEQLLCKKHAIVYPTHSCKSHVLDLLKIEYSIKMITQDYNSEDFAI